VFVCEIEKLSVVLLGSFNPAILHPSWLLSIGAISKAEADAAELELTHPDVSVVTVSDVRVEVVRERCQFKCSPTQGPRARDLAVGIFSVLEHTPISALGINREMHFKSRSVDLWHAVGHRLAPQAPWEGLLDGPGMLGVVMSGKRPKGSSTSFRVTVQPSREVSPGVWVGTNEHFDFPDKSASTALEAMVRDWDASQSYGRHLAEELLERCAPPP
jgi:hypothetical protein